jgi:hypothetical protein
VRPLEPHEVVSPVPIDPERKVLVVEPRQVEHVAARVRRERQPIAPTAPPFHEELEVLQVVGKLERGLQQHVEVRATGRAPPADARMAERIRHRLRKAPPRGDAGREERDARVHAEAARARIGLDLEHGRHAPAVLGREAPRLELHAVDHVGVEDREETAEVERAEHRDTVEKDEVLVCRAPPDVERGGEVRGGHHARQHLDRPNRVRFDEARDGAKLGQVEITHGGPGDLLEAHALAARHGLDGDALQLQGAPLQLDSDLHGLSRTERHGLRMLGVAERLDAERVGPGGDPADAEGAESVGVRARERRFLPQQRDEGTEDGSTLVVADTTLDGSLLSERGSRPGGHGRQGTEPCWNEAGSSHDIPEYPQPRPPDGASDQRLAIADGNVAARAARHVVAPLVALVGEASPPVEVSVPSSPRSLGPQQCGGLRAAVANRTTSSGGPEPPAGPVRGRARA